MPHPFMPFITEEIWQAMPVEGESVMIAPYPSYDRNISFESECEKLNGIMETITAIRNRRAEMNVPMSKKGEAVYRLAQPARFCRQ